MKKAIMKQITLNIPENHFAFFMQLVHSLSFIQVADPVSIEESLNSAQKKTWKSIKIGLEELKEVRQGKRKARPVQALLNELD
jgi:hypothetical protein